VSSPAPSTATFETTLTASGNNTGIVVPDSVIEHSGAGRHPGMLPAPEGPAPAGTPPA